MIETLPPEKKTRKRPRTKATTILFNMGGCLIFIITFFITFGAPEPEPWETAALFSLPAVAMFIGLFFQATRAERVMGKSEDEEEAVRHFHSFTMWICYVCISAYCTLWALYSLGCKSYRLFSVLAIVVVVFIIVVTGYLMCAFLHEPNKDEWPKLWNLKTGAREEPVWAIAFLFFVLFLDVGYLFGFAFAFHDQYYLSQSMPPALRMLNVDAPDEMEMPAVTAPAQKAAHPAPGAPPPVPTPTPTIVDTDFHFYFDIGRAHLSFREEVLEDKDVDKGVCNRELDDNGQPLRNAENKIKPPQRSAWAGDGYSIADFNYCSMKRLKARIEEETKEGRRTRIVLEGRSDDRRIEDTRKTGNVMPHYESNYELSAARVENVKYAVIGALKKQDHTETWHNLEWLTLASSNENDTDPVLNEIVARRGSNPEQKSANDALRDQNRRVVKASVVSITDEISSLQIRQLRGEQAGRHKLIDYMYFSLYTITTTGYGDIIPTTAYCKFVISIANICEVLFLVVFFNALVSVRGKT